MFKKRKEKIINAIQKEMETTLEETLEKLKENTPEDTYNLVESYHIKKPRKKGNTIIGSVYNNSEYAPFVEYWHNGKIFNYYKWSSRKLGGLPFYSGIWARMFERTKKEMEEKIIQNFKKLFQ